MQICPRCGACADDGARRCAFDDAALVEPFPGSRILGGRYLLEQRLAAGAMGTVFRAMHLQIGSTVAVKLVQPRQDTLQIGLARFHREAQILGQIKHPHAVLVMDFGSEQRGADSVPYLVTEYLRGTSLAERLRQRGVLELAEVARIVPPLCEAVEEAHQVGVIHRDLKPGNVFLEQLRDGSEIVKVLDFGIAKFVALAPSFLDQLQTDGAAGPDLLDELPLGAPAELDAAAPHPEGTLTDAGFMVGTIPYMAPEQMTGARVTAQTDLYAIGVLVFELLTGQRPFRGDDDAIIAAKLAGHLPSLRSRGLEVPAPLDALVQRALSLNPRQRPGSALAFAELLRGLASPVAAQPSSVSDDQALEATLTQLQRGVRGVQRAAERYADDAELDVAYRRVRDRILQLDLGLGRALPRLALPAAEQDPERRRQLGEDLVRLDADLEQLSRELHGLTRARSSEYADYLVALWARLRARLAPALHGLSQQLGSPRQGTAARVTANPFEEPAGEDAVLAALSEALDSADALEREDALEVLLGEQAGLLQGLLAAPADADPALLERLVRGLWQQAPRLLLLELYPRGDRPRVLLPLSRLEQVDAARPFGQLAALFGAGEPGEQTAHRGVDAALEDLARPGDRQVLWRCLLLHPHLAVQQRAFEQTPLADFWELVVDPRIPVATLAGIFTGVEARAPAEYLKIFFLCVRDRLAAVHGTADLRAGAELLVRFFRVPCFHEDVVFEPLLALEQELRARRRELRLELTDEHLLDELVADFTAAGAQEDQPLEQLRDVPLPIQRKLAREGHFLSHFVSHANERVASETLPHLLALEDVTRFLRIVTIHRAVLLELSRHRRFFRRQAARLALLQNPRTSGPIARQFLPLVGHEAVRQLARNRHVGADVRGLARDYWERLNRARS